MSAPVDVLAVMADGIRWLERADYPHEGLIEARAAVAELMEAALEYERATRPGANPGWAVELRPALQAALARCGGAS